MQPFRVLIIDDDPAVIRMLQRLIEEQGIGVVVARAADGPGGESAALEHRPDIVLIDLLMPGQDGLETIRRLREAGFEGAFVMISQVTEKDLVARAYKAGVEFFINKPLNLTEIVSVLRRVKEGLQMRETLRHIRASLAPLAPLDPAPAPAPGGARPGGVSPDLHLHPAPGETEIKRAARRILAALGILGEAGASDLVALALLPEFQADWSTKDAELSEIYGVLSESYQRQSGESKAPGAKAIEQRLRRAAVAALQHLAALGLEDYANPRFEQLAPIFFGFTEVRAEMGRLRQGTGVPGRINLKKFVDAFLNEVESALREAE